MPRPEADMKGILYKSPPLAGGGRERGKREPLRTPASILPPACRQAGVKREELILKPTAMPYAESAGRFMD